MVDPSRWTRQQVDDRLAKWNADLRIATQNILELMDDVSYKRLSNDGGIGATAISGKTKELVTPAIESLEEMWAILPLLTKVIDEANEKFAKLPWFKDVEPLWKIQQLLQGESIAITSKTTYAQRGLLTPDEVTQRLRPERVMDAMIEAYARAKEAVLKVGELMDRLAPDLDAASHAVLALEVDLPGDKEVARLRVRLDEINKLYVSDPLGLGNVFDGELKPTIARLEKGVAAARKERERVAADLANGDTAIAELEGAYAEAAAAEADRRDKIALDREPTPLYGREVIDELTKWLARLRATTNPKAAAIGVMNWRKQLDTRIAEARKVIADNRAPIDRRHELRGLLDGLAAKASNVGKAEDARASELFRKAHASLYTKPTRLAVAEKLVQDYLKAVR